MPKSKIKSYMDGCDFVREVPASELTVGVYGTQVPIAPVLENKLGIKLLGIDFKRGPRKPQKGPRIVRSQATIKGLDKDGVLVEITVLENQGPSGPFASIPIRGSDGELTNTKPPNILAAQRQMNPILAQFTQLASKHEEHFKKHLDLINKSEQEANQQLPGTEEPQEDPFAG
jgi:hypothetical protein